MSESKTPRTDALIQRGPLAGPRDWIAFWDMAVDAHRELESDLAAARAERDALAARVVELEAQSQLLAQERNQAWVDNAKIKSMLDAALSAKEPT